jgi:glucose/mannose transport system permease protein
LTAHHEHRLPLRRIDWLPKLVLAPSFVAAFLFIYGLIAWNGYLSVSESRLLPNYEFAGLDAYRALFDSDRFHVAAWNLVIFAAVHRRLAGRGRAAGGAARPEDPRRGRAAHRLPLPDGAELHRHRHRLEVDPQPRPGPGAHHARLGLRVFSFDWLVNPDRAIYCIVIAGIWQSAGFVMALFLAGLRGIDDSIIKAAQVDGASLPRIYWRIMLPSLRPVFFSTVMVLSHIAIKSFDLVMALTAGGPATPPTCRPPSCTWPSPAARSAWARPRPR